AAPASEANAATAETTIVGPSQDYQPPADVINRSNANNAAGLYVRSSYGPGATDSSSYTSDETGYETKTYQAPEAYAAEGLEYRAPRKDKANPQVEEVLIAAARPPSSVVAVLPSPASIATGGREPSTAAEADHASAVSVAALPPLSGSSGDETLVVGL